MGWVLADIPPVEFWDSLETQLFLGQPRTAKRPRFTVLRNELEIESPRNLATRLATFDDINIGPGAGRTPLRGFLFYSVTLVDGHPRVYQYLCSVICYMCLFVFPLFKNIVIFVVDK